MPGAQAASFGAREIGPTVISMTLALVAVFIPILFMGGLIGRLFREFSMTVAIAILLSAVVSLTLTPMLCRSEEHTSELQSLMRISYAVFCLKKKKKREQ